MKQRYLVLTLAILIIASLTNAQTWKQVTSQTLPTFTTTYFLNSNTGWLVGQKGLARKTNDGGKSWTEVVTNITEDLKSVFLLDADNVFIGSQTKIYKTKDGGLSWTTINVTGAISSNANIVSIYFADSQKGWVISSSSSAAKVLQTIDGGTTWTVGADNPAGDLEAMDFFNPTNGVAVGGGAGKCDLWYTKDGKTWTKTTAPTFPAGYSRLDIRCVFMVDQNIVYAAGWGSMVGAQPSIHLKSIDGGVTWTYLAQSDANKTFDNINDIYFKDANNGVAIGGGSKSSIVLKTSDGGVTWKFVDIPCGASLSSVYGFSNNLIVSSSSSFLSSTDFGTSWLAITKIPSFTINSIHAINNNLIYAGGMDGTLLKTMDGGKNWETFYQRANLTSISIQGVYFVNENVGYTATSYRSILKTVDGGKTWTMVMKDTTDATQTNYGVHFINENLGWVAGKAGGNIDVIYKTINGGATWTTTKSKVAANLRGIAFFDAQNGIAVGEKLKALYTRDGGNTWTPSTFSGVPTASATATLREVTFTSATSAVAVGDKLILRTNDGGATWNYITVSDLIHSMTGIAAQGNTVWAVGAKTTSPKGMAVYQSVDGGLTWSNKATAAVFDSTNAIYDVTITPNGSVFVGAGKSVVYTNSTAVGIEEENQIPTAFELKQNYPNPFNPETVISYQLPVASYVTLKVYDILGKEVATLVNEFKQPGVYFSTFFTLRSSFASGIYFYILRAGDFVSIRKMVLIK